MQGAVADDAVQLERGDGGGLQLRPTAGQPRRPLHPRGTMIDGCSRQSHSKFNAIYLGQWNSSLLVFATHLQFASKSSKSKEANLKFYAEMESECCQTLERIPFPVHTESALA